MLEVPERIMFIWDRREKKAKDIKKVCKEQPSIRVTDSKAIISLIFVTKEFELTFVFLFLGSSSSTFIYQMLFIF